MFDSPDEYYTRRDIEDHMSELDEWQDDLCVVSNCEELLQNTIDKKINEIHTAYDEWEECLDNIEDPPDEIEPLRDNDYNARLPDIRDIFSDL